MISEKVIQGKSNVLRYMLDLARSFCSYVRHGERGKLDRRAIASVNPRLFFHIIESFHLELGKHMDPKYPCGDEKRKKMFAEMSAGSLRVA